jgi:hypothetical protein
MAPANLAFIVSSTTEKADPATRKLIRSHVMRGKKPKRSRPGGPRTANRVANRRPIKLEEFIETYAPLFPGRVGSDLSFVTFADEIEPWILSNMTAVSPVAMRVIFPLVVAIGFQADNTEPLYTLDAAVLHITAFAVEGFIDRILRGQKSKAKTNPTAMLHFQKGLRILRERLLGQDDEIKISNSTISVVLKLASTAHFEGEYQAAKQHMEGLRQMVDLRGGLNAFKGSKLLMEMAR